MDHPGIARVFDAGATDAGRPFFAMELVDGLPVTDYCDANGLIVRRRLELFIAVCRAVQHAHQKGVIHRDLKPSNVLVTLVDGEPVPKVIDFGIAKATGGRRLIDETLVTDVQQLVGTPEYMSPEQAGANGGDVDTRSDVYALGVLLYELLTGATPFAHKQLRSLGYEEVRRIIREDEPPRPSTRLKPLGEAVPAGHGRRRGEPGRLARALRRELDWVAMKCLEKDRCRRYETVNALASDVERYLKDEPVFACPPSAKYRFGKFARRNKATVATAALLLLLLVIIGGAFGWLMREAVLLKSDLADARYILGVDDGKEAREREANLRQALRLNPDLADAHAELARMLQSRDLIEAEQEHRHAVRLKPGEPNFHARFAMFLAKQSKVEEAEAEMREALRMKPSDLDYRHALGEIYACRGEWDKAAKDALSNLDTVPKAAVLLHIGDIQGYRRICSLALKRQGGWPDPPADTAMICLLTPDAVEDKARIVELARESLRNTEDYDGRWYYELVNALADYRAGEHTDALERLETISPRPTRHSMKRREPDGGTAAVYAISALAHHQLGDRRSAESALARAKAVIEEKMPRPEQGRPFEYRNWENWLHALILCREAEAVVNGNEGNR
jgi:tetratricopeptide (TPR) repeat protein